MLRYYSYYSVGGYKDFILGNSESGADATYYFPLLPVLEERAKTDKEAAKQVSELKALPAIEQLSADNTHSLPDSARIMFSHAGYKLIYKHLEGEKYAIAIRDISNQEKDETGRNIPFLFVIVGENSGDRKTLDILCTYIASNIKVVESMLCNHLSMDSGKNGLCFKLADFNKWVKAIILQHPSTTLCTVRGEFNIKVGKNKVALLVIPEHLTEATALSEQKLQTLEVFTMKDLEIISNSDSEKLAKQVKLLTQQLNEERKKNESMKKGMVAAGIGGFIFGALISGCCRN